MIEQMDLGGAVTDALRAVALFVPKLLAFVAIVMIGWLVARALQKVCTAALHRIGFERAAERGGLHRMLARSPYDASGVVGKLVYYAVLLIALQIGFGVWGPNPVSDLIQTVIGYLPQVAVAIAIVVIAASIARAVRDIVGTALGALTYGRMLATGASYCVLGVGGIAALNQIGVAVTVTMPILVAVLATVGGICVVGIGGGLIRPMQQRWERILSQAETQSRQINQHAKAYAAGRSDTTTQFVAAPASTVPSAGAPVVSVPVTADGWPSIDDTAEHHFAPASGEIHRPAH
jgi:hypothetical protein